MSTFSVIMKFHVNVFKKKKQHQMSSDICTLSTVIFFILWISWIFVQCRNVSMKSFKLMKQLHTVLILPIHFLLTHGEHIDFRFCHRSIWSEVDLYMYLVDMLSKYVVKWPDLSHTVNTVPDDYTSAKVAFLNSS